ncbi:hypothetical protein NZD89_19695 [Alicyclobacillus fastidiosus]|uniref:Uncharacterized protein n=1 Tax=Alicyclobacillus fastidiosus TaxID=392011 RepID=A0ABY6ZE51_9BACL|nr:hypothetical protein [Alicyclobacillus fastidiosus]WAH40521.1 hypothetical protein NZD89_19695 [Alicyclobacillus fastidiosus]GMA61945.1 hypothetical protein GCM10025859_23850 [Alicyclobacillus fastidiosus]
MKWPMLALLVIVCSFVGSLAGAIVFGVIAKHWIEAHMHVILQSFVGQFENYMGL